MKESIFLPLRQTQWSNSIRLQGENNLCIFKAFKHLNTVLIMSRTLFFLLITTLCYQCKPSDLSEPSKQEILKAEKAMNALASTSGFNTALLAFADDSLIKPEDGKLPVIGKLALEELWQRSPGTKDISWAPLRVVASKSGDIGYTFGNWKFVTRDTTYHGNYFTAWEKQTDGSWKWTLDGGNNTPAPR